MKRKIVTIFPSFANKGGAEDMAIAIAEGLAEENDTPVILSQDKEVASYYKCHNCHFEPFSISNIRKYHRQGAIFVSHHRKLTTYLRIISRLFFLNKIKIVHVAHNTFDNLKKATLFPKVNVAVSHSVKENMISFFGLPEFHIRVIYNGLTDLYDSSKDVKRINDNTINILYLGRIVPVKQQVNFVRETKGKLNANIKVFFGGVGKDYDLLKSTIGSDSQYVALGLIDISKELEKFDYVCLISENEGLPLSLIQGCMFGKPLITNNLPQSLEVNENNVTGWVGSTWKEIIEVLNNLPAPDSEEYKRYSARARKAFETKFSYPIMVEEYKDLIDSSFPIKI